MLTLLGDVGPWSERIYLAGGLAPRYLVGRLPAGTRAHVGTTDVDLIIGLALGGVATELVGDAKHRIWTFSLLVTDQSDCEQSVVDAECRISYRTSGYHIRNVDP